MSCLVMPTAYLASTCSISMTSSMFTSGPLVTVDNPYRRRGGHGLAGQHPAVGDLIFRQGVVGVHHRPAFDQPGHAGGAVARLARGRWRQSELAGRLQERRPGAVGGGAAPAVELDRDGDGPGLAAGRCRAPGLPG